MKSSLILFLIALTATIVTSMAMAKPPELVQCSQVMQANNIPTCTDLSPIAEHPDCSRKLHVGDHWMDEFQINSAEEMYSIKKNATDNCLGYLTSEVEADESGNAEFCCGG